MNTSSESPSSRPMTLRQQLAIAVSANYPGTTASKQFLDDCMMFVDRYSQEIAREARLDELSAFVQATDTPGVEWKVWHKDAEKYLDARATELTQKPPHYPNGRDEPCEICGDGGHTEIACTNLSEESR